MSSGGGGSEGGRGASRSGRKPRGGRSSGGDRGGRGGRGGRRESGGGGRRDGGHREGGGGWRSAGSEAPLPPLEDLFVGAASLVHELDKRVLVVLRDGRHLVGRLRTYDQFSNVVLEDTVERHAVDGIVGDIPVGLFVIRGENIVMLGEVDDAKEKYMMENVLRPAEPNEVLAAEAAKRGDSWELPE